MRNFSLTIKYKQGKNERGKFMDESKLYAYCLQGDVTKAFNYLQSIPIKSKMVQELEEQFEHRFFTEKPEYHFKTTDPCDLVMPDYENSEFQVSYLKHEAQHLSDYTEFPGLDVNDLEYRAKLVELIYEPDSSRLLRKFFYEQKNDLHHPHPYSSFCIMHSLTPLLFGEREVNELEVWNNVDTIQIQDCAKALYEEHTNLLKSTGRKGII
jgi:hypothetical protein